MLIICILSEDNHAHQSIDDYSDTIKEIPIGWAFFPESLQPAENFPFGDLLVADVSKDNIPEDMNEDMFGDRDTIQRVVEWIPFYPEPEPEPEPTELEKLQGQVLYTAIMTDTLLPTDEEEEESDNDA